MKKTTKAARVPVQYLGTVVAMALMILAIPSLAGAGIVFQYNYDNQAGASEDPCGPPWDYRLDTDNAGFQDSDVLTDTGNLFGEGTSNKYYRQTDNITGGGQAYATLDEINETLATFSLDFIDQPTSDPNSRPESFNLNVIKVGGTSVFGSQRSHNLDFSGGALNGVGGAYTQGQKHHLDMVVNMTGAAVNYSSPMGAVSVNPNKVDVWIDGILKIDDATRNGKTSNVDIGGIGFQSGNSSIHGDVLIDNVVLRDEAFVIPESTTLILLVIGLLTAAAVCGRRK